MLSAKLEHISFGEHFSFLNCIPESFIRSNNWIFFFSPGAITPIVVVFYSPLAGFSLLACEVS